MTSPDFRAAAAAITNTSEASRDEPQPMKIVCHAPGDRCGGCDHYHGKAPVCKYAPEPQGSAAGDLTREQIQGSINVQQTRRNCGELDVTLTIDAYIALCNMALRSAAQDQRGAARNSGCRPEQSEAAGGARSAVNPVESAGVDARDGAQPLAPHQPELQVRDCLKYDGRRPEPPYNTESRSEQAAESLGETIRKGDTQSDAPASPAGSAVEEVKVEERIGSSLGRNLVSVELALRHAEELDRLRQRLAEAEGLLREIVNQPGLNYSVRGIEVVLSAQQFYQIKELLNVSK